MENIFEYETWINEKTEWKTGGWVIIKGKLQADGGFRLYAASAKHLRPVAFTKDTGDPVYMAHLYEDILMLTKDKEGNIVPKKVLATPEYLKKWLNMDGFSLVLRKNKTPMWKETVCETNLNAILRKNKDLLIHMPMVNLPVY